MAFSQPSEGSKPSEGFNTDHNQAAFELMVITPEGDLSEEIEWVNKLFAAGLETLHLRKPGWNNQRLQAYLKAVAPQFHNRIMLHYREELTKTFKLKGIHYQCENLPVRRRNYRVSCGAHSWQEFLEVSAVVDYAFVSPFFNSISKQGYRANEELMEIPQEVERGKAVALGGIDSGNIHYAREQSMKGAAVLGTVWQSDNPLKAFLELKSKTEEWQRKGQ